MLAAFAASLASIQADEPIKLAPASGSPISSAIFTNTFKLAERTSIADTNSFSLSRNQPAGKTNFLGSTMWRPTDDFQSTAPIAIVIKKNLESTGLFSHQSSVGSVGFAGIEAGYGQAYNCDSIVLRGRNGTAWEETRYVFLKKVVRF